MIHKLFNRFSKKILLVSFLLILSLNIYANPGNGISYRINNFRLMISWPEADEYDFVEIGRASCRERV
jgi:hypothetical protein